MWSVLAKLSTVKASETTQELSSLRFLHKTVSPSQTFSLVVRQIYTVTELCTTSNYLK